MALSSYLSRECRAGRYRLEIFWVQVYNTSVPFESSNSRHCYGYHSQWRIQECEKGGAQVYIHVNPKKSFGGANGEPPSEASQPLKGGAGVLPRKI